MDDLEIKCYITVTKDICLNHELEWVLQLYDHNLLYLILSYLITKVNYIHLSKAQQYFTVNEKLNIFVCCS